VCADRGGQIDDEIEPYAYLRRMLAELPMAQTVEQIEALLPWGIKPAA